MIRPTARSRDSELEELCARLAEAEETLEAIRQGEVDAVVVSALDGDKVFTLQGAEKPYRVLIETINEGALTILQDGTVLYCNRRFAEMVARPSQHIMGSSFYSFFSPEERDRLRRLLAGISPAGAKEEFTLCSSSGHSAGMPAQLSLAPLKIDNVKAVGIIATDLTERKRQEEILRHLNVALEQRVSEHTEEVTLSHRALEQAQAKLREYAGGLETQVAERTAALQQSVKSLEQFCYTIAHDLRAPLRTMSGFTTSLLEDFGPLLPPEGHEFARRIATGAERMDQLIRDLLAYGRLNSAELPVSATDPALFIREFMSAPESKPALIDIEEPLPKVLANPIALDQVFKNLLSNAVKFVAPGVRPEVHVFAEERGDSVRIAIRDNGIGIDPKFHDRIFRVFERLSATVGAYPGTGIGLAIVQKGVERMGGSVGVESELGKGSCFWIELKKTQ